MSSQRAKRKNKESDDNKELQGIAAALTKFGDDIRCGLTNSNRTTSLEEAVTLFYSDHYGSANDSEADDLKFVEFLTNNESYCKLFCLMPHVQRVHLIKEKSI